MIAHNKQPLQDNQSADLEADDAGLITAELRARLLAAKQRIKDHKQGIKKERAYIDATLQEVVMVYQESASSEASESDDAE